MGSSSICDANSWTVEQQDLDQDVWIKVVGEVLLVVLVVLVVLAQPVRYFQSRQLTAPSASELRPPPSSNTAACKARGGRLAPLTAEKTPKLRRLEVPRRLCPDLE